MSAQFSAIVIGGGFYGLRMALHLHNELGARRVAVIEQATDVMSRASYNNQARVHNGYHYPRSILTGYRSRVSMPRFLADFPEAIDGTFDHFYAVSRYSSKVTARQFEEYCRRIGAPLEAAPAAVVGLFTPRRVEKVYRVVEPVFDSRKVRERVMELVEQTGAVEVFTGTTALNVSDGGGVLRVETDKGDFEANKVFNTAYSSINAIQRGSSLANIPLQHELAEMALVDCSETPFATSGMTVMDGPFFSLLPFPDRKLHTLSHVRYTPHARWTDSQDGVGSPAAWSPDDPPPASSFVRMRADVARHIPKLRSLKQVGSLWEVKTVLPQSSGDDSRPILYRSGFGLEGYTVVMGGKLDNVYDALEEMSRAHAS